MADYSDVVSVDLVVEALPRDTWGVVEVFPGPDPTYYVQRLWDTGTAGWVYYTKAVIDPTPLSTETTPNYSGAISVHSVVEILA